MKQKKLSIMISFIWLFLLCGLYLFSALICKFPLYYILERPPLEHQLLGTLWLLLPPLCWWIPRKVLMRKEKWHPVGTVIFCIGSAWILIGDAVLLTVQGWPKNTAFWERYCDPSSMLSLLLILSILLAFELFFFLFHCVNKTSDRPQERDGFV